MASNRDPLKDYRINKRGRKVTSSATRSARSKKASAPKPTSSSTRSRGKGTGSKKVTSSSDRVTKKPLSGGPRGAQGPRTAPQQGPSRPVKGLIGSRGPSPSKPPIQKPPKAPGRFVDKPQVKANVKALQNSPLGKLIRGGGKIGAALTIAEGAKEFFKGKKKQSETRKENQGAAYRAQQKPLPKVKQPAAKPDPKPKKKPQPQQKLGAGAKAFDAAFAKARAAGKTTFTFRGKSYNTKLKK